jgi:predicted permease
LGYYFAEWGTRVLLILGSDSSTPLPIDVTPNSRILGFTLAISLLAAILFGLAPALIVTGQDVNSALKASSVARPRLLLSRPLVVGQVALSLLLLTGAGLFVRTLLNLRTLDLGFAAEHVVQARVSPQTSGYKREQYADLYRRLHERLQSAPGVSSASLSASGFLAGSSRTCCIAVEGYFHQPEENREVQTLKVTPGYFETMGVPLLMGRDFASSDVPSKPGESPKVAIINETMSRYYFGDANPLGRRFGWGDGQVKYEFEIVGVAKDAIYGDLRNRTASLIYFPSLGESLLVVRASSVSASLLETIRREIQKVDQNLEISSILTIPQLMDQALVQERLLAKLSGFFGLLALLLASIGLYGVRSYDVTRRTREIGIRMALGAGRRQVSRMVLRETLWLVSIGLAIGLAASLVTARLIASLLFGVTDKDPLTMALAAMLLLAVAAFAGWLPARRASRVDPMVALRHE